MQLLETPRMNAAAMPIPLGDPGTHITIQQMRRLIDSGSKNPAIYERAAQLIRQYNLRSMDFRGAARAIFDSSLRDVKYWPDIRGKETIKSADETLRLGIGDCDCFTVLILTEAAALGMRGRIVTISSDAEDPDIFTHVYPEVEISPDNWIALDAARKGPRFGRQPGHYFRKRIWAANSDDYEDVAGLGGAPRLARVPLRSHGLRGRRRLRGLGQTTSVSPTSEAGILMDIAAAGQAAATDITAANAPSYYSAYAYPYGATVYSPAVAAPLTGIPTGTILLLGGGLVLLLLFMRGQEGRE